MKVMEPEVRETTIHVSLWPLYTHAHTAVCAHPPHKLTHILNEDARTYAHS